MRMATALEHPPIRLTRPDRKAAAPANKTGAFAGRPNVSIWSAKALGLTIALSLGSTPPAAASAAFIARPTEPLACPSDPAGNLWQGYFHGRKEVDFGFMKYEDVAERYCFRTEKLCRNWLYNMQSEYSENAWSAVCTRY